MLNFSGVKLSAYIFVETRHMIFKNTRMSERFIERCKNKLPGVETQWGSGHESVGRELHVGPEGWLPGSSERKCCSGRNSGACVRVGLVERGFVGNL